MERYSLMAVVPTLTALLLSSLVDLQFFFVFLYALCEFSCAKHYRQMYQSPSFFLRWILATLLDPLLLNERCKSPILLLGPNQAIEKRRQNPHHSHTRRNVLISNRSCSDCNQLSIAHVRKHHIFYFRLCPDYPDKFENSAIYLRLGLPSTLIHQKNGAFRTRSSNKRNLKISAVLSSVDGKHFRKGDACDSSSLPNVFLS